MKWILLFLITSSLNFSYATIARLTALGQPTKIGSFYILDSRSMFRNPANINDLGQQALVEWGTAASTASTEDSPHAEGGALFQRGKWTFGMYYGNEAESLNNRRRDITNTTGEAGFLAEDDPITFFIGGTQWENWGVSVSVARKLNEQASTTYDKKHSSVNIKGGVSAADTEFYFKYLIRDRSTGGDDQRDRWDRRGQGLFGLKYEFTEGQFIYGSYEIDGAKYTNGTGNELDYEILEYNAGWAKVKKLKTGQLNFDSRLVVRKEQFTNATGVKNLYRNLYIPFTVSFEVRAKEWLVLRGSVSYEIFGYNKGKEDFSDESLNEKKITRSNSTTVNAGMGLDFGNLKIDGVIGTTENAGRKKQGQLNLDDLASRVSLIYAF